MKRTLAVLALVVAAAAAAVPACQAAPQIRHISPELQKAVAATDYKSVRIKSFPFASEAWTFREFTFVETLAKLKELGVAAVEAFPGQALAAEFPGARFGEAMTDEQVAFAKEALKANGVALYGYGVVDIGTTEESMRKVFDFARKMGIRVVVCEPADDDFTLLEKLVKEYNIKIAIHNHPAPSKYNLPGDRLRPRRRQGPPHRLLRRQRPLDAGPDRPARGLQAAPGPHPGRPSQGPQRLRHRQGRRRRPLGLRAKAASGTSWPS
ncbi:MAG: sugar phosphate isomerase/epimerase [Candidatus Moduliflexus flocculans]|nr:sugar phosphate isomerase/epimerase [Candidatus Moduliflexus flocculans]